MYALHRIACQAVAQHLGVAIDPHCAYLAAADRIDVNTLVVDTMAAQAHASVGPLRCSLGVSWPAAD